MNDQAPLSCPLCAHRFVADPRCHAGCPMARSCTTVCCPNCGLTFVDEQRSTLARLVRQLLPRRVR